MMGDIKLEFSWKNKVQKPSTPGVELEDYVTEEHQNFEGDDNDRSWKR
jgi:hypothetical protein